MMFFITFHPTGGDSIAHIDATLLQLQAALLQNTEQVGGFFSLLFCF